MSAQRCCYCMRETLGDETSIDNGTVYRVVKPTKKKTVGWQNQKLSCGALKIENSKIRQTSLFLIIQRCINIQNVVWI